MAENPDDDRAIKLFQEYIRIPSAQPNPDYAPCVEFLTKQAEEIGLEMKIYEMEEGKPTVILTLQGSQPKLGTILLNSHTDVVPVEEEYWHHDPFGAEIDENGNIYGRGTQDTKGLGIQFLEAIRRLKQNGQTFLRTIHISFVPDEEEGDGGMVKFVETDEFKALNVAFALDEGGANEGPEFVIYNGEKSPWHIFFHANGTEGHGSTYLKDTPGEKLRLVIDQALDYRKKQAAILDNDPSLTVSDITFLNFTQVQGGTEVNVVPVVMSATFDIRVAVDEDHDKLSALLLEWAEKAGDNVEVEFYLKEPPTPVTPLDDSNPFWKAMKKTFDSLEVKVISSIMAGATDSRFLRRHGIPAIAFSPMNNTPDLAHANDEFVNKDVFLRGIQIFLDIIPALANVSEGNN